MGDVLTRKCRHGVLINEGFLFDDVPQHHTTPDTTVWIDLCRPSKSSASGPPETTHRPHNPHIPVETVYLRYPKGRLAVLAVVQQRSQVWRRRSRIPKLSGYGSSGPTAAKRRR
jgi:hypothetical protein